MHRHASSLRSVVPVVLGLALAGRASAGKPGGAGPTTQRPGPIAGGTLLPNGWRLAPAGRQVVLGNMPLAMVESRDRRYVMAGLGGFLEPGVVVVDTKDGTVEARLALENAWLGLALHPDGKHLYVSAANANAVKEISCSDGALTPLRDLALPAQEGEGDTFVGGIAVAPDGHALFAVRVFSRSVSRLELPAGTVTKTVALPVEPYTCLPTPDGKRLLVSLWGGARVVELDAATLDSVREIPVGEHPSAMALSPDGRWLFVACANTNAVWVVDRDSGKAVEQVAVSLRPDDPPGTTPNGLSLSPDGKTLLVANADNNDVAVVDVASPAAAHVRGFIPTGWYPTSVLWSGDGAHLYVTSGKGLRSRPNPDGPRPGRTRPDGASTINMLQGTLAILATPGDAELERDTRTVFSLTPAREGSAAGEAHRHSAIPRRAGDASPIHHVFYVIRENRTYDQVLGDMPEGNGDPSLTLFGAKVTPNAHALARQFVLLDNFYVNAEVSYDGHEFSMAAYATDVTEKLVQTVYANRGSPYLGDGQGPARNAFGNLVAPAEGYLWDACRKAGVTLRDYGEFVSSVEKPTPGGPLVEATVPGLAGLVDPDYPPFDMSITDQHRVDVWEQELHAYERDGNLPQLSIIRLPDDHTAYTRPGSPTPAAMVADNDLALGRIVEDISHGPYWKDSAIFVLEDDAQGGPDHVDAHRSVALAVSPYVRHGTVDHALTTTAGLLRTMELILGLAPMSQYDAAATPLRSAFGSNADLAPYVRRPAEVPLDAVNPETAYAAEVSRNMDLAEADRVPDLAGDEILWKAVKGADSAMPPPRHAAFVVASGGRFLPDDDGDDDDAPKRPQPARARAR